VAGEQYSLGGADNVRGYYDYEQTGDQGWSTQWSLQTPYWAVASGWKVAMLTFVDRGHVMLHDPLSGQVARANLGSYGLGWRLESTMGLQVGLDVAMPVFKTIRAADGCEFEAATKKQPRVEVRAQQAF